MNQRDKKEIKSWCITLLATLAVAEEESTQPLRLKLDPGSRHTGLTLLDGERVVWLGQVSTDTYKPISSRRHTQAGFLCRVKSKVLRVLQGGC